MKSSVSFLLCIISYPSELHSFTAHNYIAGCPVLVLTDSGSLKALINCFLCITASAKPRTMFHPPCHCRSGGTGAHLWVTVTFILHPLSNPLCPEAHDFAPGPGLLLGSPHVIVYVSQCHLSKCELRRG